MAAALEAFLPELISRLIGIRADPDAQERHCPSVGSTGARGVSGRTGLRQLQSACIDDSGKISNKKQLPGVIVHTAPSGQSSRARYDGSRSHAHD